MDERQTPEPTIEVRWRRNRASHVILGGDHDVSTAGRIESVLTETLSRSSRMVVDLRETHFIDTSTIRVLLAAKGMADGAKKPFTLVLGESSIVLGSSSIVERVFELTQAIAMLNLAPDLDEALAADRPRFPLRALPDTRRAGRAPLRDVSLEGDRHVLT